MEKLLLDACMMYYYVPKLTNNLFSVNAAAQKGNVVCFGHKYCWIRKGRKLVRTGLPIGKLYKLNCDVQRPPPFKGELTCKKNF